MTSGPTTYLMAEDQSLTSWQCWWFLPAVITRRNWAVDHTRKCCRKSITIWTHLPEGGYIIYMPIYIAACVKGIYIYTIVYIYIYIYVPFTHWHYTLIWALLPEGVWQLYMSKSMPIALLHHYISTVFMSSQVYYAFYCTCRVATLMRIDVCNHHRFRWAHKLCTLYNVFDPLGMYRCMCGDQTEQSNVDWNANKL